MIADHQLVGLLERKLSEVGSVGRKLVFWWDERREFSDVADSLVLPSGALVFRVDERRLFYAKVTILTEYADKDLVVYCPFPVPALEDDFLFDLRAYGVDVVADSVALKMADFGWRDLRLRPYLSERLSVFGWGVAVDDAPQEDDTQHLKRKNKNTAKKPLSKYETVNAYVLKYANTVDSTETLRTLLAAAWLEASAPDANEIIRILLSGGTNETTNPAWIEFTKVFNHDDFSSLTQTALRTNTRVNTLREITRDLLITHLSDEIRTALHPNLRQHTLTNTQTATAFVNNWMRDMRYFEAYKTVARALEVELGAATVIGGVDVLGEHSAVTLPAFDAALLDEVRVKLVEGKVPRSSLIAALQRRGGSFWLGDYRERYDFLLAAAEFLQVAEGFVVQGTTADTIFDEYCASGHRVDAAYRRVVVTADAAGEVGGLFEYCNDVYDNDFLSTLSNAWGKAVGGTDEVARWGSGFGDATRKLANLGGRYSGGVTMQSLFFSEFVAPRLLEPKNKVLVIVSDALRFEAGFEVFNRLRSANPNVLRLDAMLGVLPSVTEFGMAALLPGADKGLGFTSSGVTVGEKGVSVRGEGRARVLEGVGHKSVAFEDLPKKSKKADWDALFGDSRVVFAFHDVIDAVGDKAVTEDRVFAAVGVAVDEISAAAKSAMGTGRTIIVTADHGFLYQRNVIGDHIRVEQPPGNELTTGGRRVIAGSSLKPALRTQRFMVPGVKDDDFVVQAPLGVMRYALRGGGDKYVHGGASLQEVVIPVITIEGTRKNADPNFSRPVPRVAAHVTYPIDRNMTTNAHFTVTLVQDAPTGDDLAGRTARVHLVTEDGDVATTEKLVQLTSSSSDPHDRAQNVTLMVLPKYNGRYDCTLRVTDAETNDVIFTCPWRIRLTSRETF
jgi:uncharacterized protein (TIGR02687 family)